MTLAILQHYSNYQCTDMVWIGTLRGQCLWKFDIPGHHKKSRSEIVSPGRPERHFPNVAQWPGEVNVKRWLNDWIVTGKFNFMYVWLIVLPIIKCLFFIIKTKLIWRKYFCFHNSTKILAECWPHTCACFTLSLTNVFYFIYLEIYSMMKGKTYSIL